MFTRMTLPPPATTATTNDLDGLTTEITALKHVYGQLEQLRRLPKGLVKDGTVQLEALKGARDALLGESAQKALERAAKDESDVQLSRTGAKKRQKSPEPYVREVKTKPTIFPQAAPCTNLRELILAWGSDHPTCRVSLWRARRSDSSSEDVVLVKVTDVLNAYLMLGKGVNGEYVVEAASVFGPREGGGGPFSSSQYGVFRMVSERVGGMLSQTSAGVSGVLSLLESYRGLFIDGCSACGRVLSAEGHVPPVDRIWGDEGWYARHVTCR